MAEVLENQEAFSPGAFPSTVTAQQRFALRLLGRRYGRPEIPARNWLTFLSAGILTFLAGIYLDARGQNGAAQAAQVLTALHLLLASMSFLRKIKLKQPILGGHPHACHKDADGDINISLYPKEKIAARLVLDTPQREWIRWVAGLAQTFWGLLLAGIIPVFVLDETYLSISVVVAILFTFVGTLLFGKGIRDIWGLRFAQMLFVTNQRMVMTSGPGEARTVPWTFLKQRPLIIGREGEGVTLAFALIPLVSVGRLPALGLWGKDQMNEEAARDLASFVVRSRQALLNEEDEG
jgi:hypothetical protein